MLNLDNYLQKLSNIDGATLYERIKKKYGGIGGFDNYFNKFMYKYNGDKGQLLNLKTAIEKKIGEYIQNNINNNKTSIRQNNTNTIYNNVELQKYLQQDKFSGVKKTSNVSGMDDVYKDNKKYYQTLANNMNKNYDTYFANISNLINNSATQYKTAYNKIFDRLNKYEQTLNDTFLKLKDRTKAIGDAYETQINAGNAAAASAAEKDIRAMGGKGSLLRVANYVQELDQQGKARLADVHAKLNNQLNQLDTQYLQLKKAIMNDKNITEGQRTQILDNINQRLGMLEQQKNEWNNKYNQLLGQADKEQIDYNKQIASMYDNNKIQHKLMKINTEWENNPLNRDIMINKLISNLNIGSIPPNILEKIKNAPSYFDALKILNDVVYNGQNSKLNTLLKYYKQKTGASNSAGG